MQVKTPQSELYNKLLGLGWSLNKIEFRQGLYIAKADNDTTGQEIERAGKTPEMALASVYQYATRAYEVRRLASVKKIAAWSEDWLDQVTEIGQAYSKMPPFDQKAVPAWKALAAESRIQADAIRKQITVEVVDDPEPYQSAQEMCEDVHKNKHFSVSRANSEHPVWSVEDNINFRIVHDVLGHCFVPGTMVRTRDGFKPIEEIEIGDEVLSGNGEWNRVYKVLVREYDGPLVVIDTPVSANPIRVTPEHPMLALVGKHVRPHRQSSCSTKYCANKPHLHTVEWVAAGDLAPDNFLISAPQIPDAVVPRSIATPHEHVGPRSLPIAFDLDDEFLWMVGLYLAEGSSDGYGKISFALHKDEVESFERLKSFWVSYGFAPKERKEVEGYNGRVLIVHNMMLASWLPAWLGRGSHNKAIPAELLNLSVEKLNPLLQGIMDGDGYQKMDRLEQTSPVLALQVAEIGLRSGRMPSISSHQRIDRKRVYTLHEASQPGERRGSKRGFWLYLGQLGVKITSLESEHYNGKVYNLSVENDPTYTVENVVVHNCQSGGDFSWRGENLACGVHFPLVSPLAREALFTECIGQQAYYRTFHGFGPQKVGFLSQYLHPVQERQGEHVWVPHGGVPDLAPAANGNAKGTMDAAPGMQGIFNSPGDWVQPSQFTMPMAAPPSPTFAMPTAVMQPFEVKTHQVEAAKMVSPDRPYDPNRFFQPSVQSAPLEDPTNDYIGIADTVDNAAKIDTNWQEEDEATQKRAIINAFRVALLSPRKHLKWNAAHYQAIMHTDPGTKAVDLWNLLEEAREKHNQALGYPEGSHLSYRKQLDFLAHELQVDDPSLSNAAAVREAKEIVFRKVKEFEAQLGADPANEDTSELKRYNMARKLVDAWLKENYTPVRGWQPGQMTLASDSDSEPKLFETDDEWKPIDASGFASQDAKYGAFMGTHLDAIEEVGQHIDQIRDAALKDLDEDSGKGFIFRNAVMNMNLKGVNPKVASFAWLLLAPMTSELGIIDTHVLRGLRRSEQDMTPRDYYKLERMQRAGKDATGYSHLPLGLYHWGLWDAIRNPGEHSDHSPLRILDPLPWDSPSAKWDAAMNAKSGPWVGPMQFENARGHMEQTANDFDQEMAGQPHNLIPLAKAPFKQESAPNAYVVPSL